jgi:hypothetical protein
MKVITGAMGIATDIIAETATPAATMAIPIATTVNDRIWRR